MRTRREAAAAATDGDKPSVAGEISNPLAAWRARHAGQLLRVMAAGMGVGESMVSTWSRAKANGTGTLPINSMGLIRTYTMGVDRADFVDFGDWEPLKEARAKARRAAAAADARA